MKQGFYKRIAHLLIVSFILMASSGCTMASSNPYSEDVGLSLSPNARLYSYFILVGVARGEIMVGHIKRYDIPSLLAIDKEARNAIIQNKRFSSLKTDYNTDQKLIAYLSMLRQHS